MLQTVQNKYCDCLYLHSLCNILYVLQLFYTINVNVRLLQPDTDFIGVSNIRVCLGQLQANANTISGAGSRGQRSGLAHEIERMAPPFEHGTGLSKSRNSNNVFVTFFIRREHRQCVGTFESVELGCFSDI